MSARICGRLVRWFDAIQLVAVYAGRNANLLLAPGSTVRPSSLIASQLSAEPREAKPDSSIKSVRVILYVTLDCNRDRQPASPGENVRKLLFALQGCALHIDGIADRTQPSIWTKAEGNAATM